MNQILIAFAFATVFVFFCCLFESLWKIFVHPRLEAAFERLFQWWEGKR